MYTCQLCLYQHRKQSGEGDSASFVVAKWWGFNDYWMIIFSNSSICSMGRSALDNVHARGIQRNGLATVRIYIFEYRPMSTHTGTHHAPRSDSDLCLTHLHKYPDPQVRFPMVLPTGKPTKIHGLPRVATCLNIQCQNNPRGSLLPVGVLLKCRLRVYE